jgi:hypothetical protein
VSRRLMGVRAGGHAVNYWHCNLRKREDIMRSCVQEKGVPCFIAASGSKWKRHFVQYYYRACGGNRTLSLRESFDDAGQKKGVAKAFAIKI